MSHYILVHGAWEESGMWDNVLPILRRSGHTVTAVDLPRYGVNRNSVSLVTSKVYLDALLEVINKADRRRRHGRVYRARDTTLDRDVAIKVLPDAFASDPDRLARFEREAKVLASLNHPNIGKRRQRVDTAAGPIQIKALMKAWVLEPRPS